MLKVNWMITDENITVNYEGQTHIISRVNQLADKLILMLKNKDYDNIPNFISISKRIEKESNNKFVVVNGKIMVEGVEAPAALSNKIIKFSEQGLPYEPLMKFAKSLQNNPSFRAVNELFLFLEKNDHPITENGCFIAYKRVRKDFKDIYTGTMDNSVGNVVEMPRNQVNEDCNQTCSNGLHVANWEYAHNLYSQVEGDIMLEVEVNPADVVSVPTDYNSAKMRTCKYKVLGVVDKENSTDVALRYVNAEPDYGLGTDEVDCDVDFEDEYPWDDEFDELD